MSTTKKLQQAKLNQWAVLCKEQSESSLTIRQWCEQNGYTIHTYDYWKHRLKESYIDSVLPDIAPISPQVPASLHELHDSRKSPESCINNHDLCLAFTRFATQTHLILCQLALNLAFSP